MDSSLLDVRDVRIYYSSVRGEYRVVDGVSFSAYRNEILGLAGESGCGKSTLVEGLLRLVVPPGYIKSGEALSQEITRDVSQNCDLLSLTEEEFRRIRWRNISYIPQGAMNSLNPILKVEDQIVDAILTHEKVSKRDAQARVPELLSAVGLPAQVAAMYPHELSGGMKQRAIIAAAIALKPCLIIADEPTTALDVTIQRVILETLLRVREQLGATIIVVTHDMPVHAQLADRLVIMYAGKVMEIGTIHDLFDDPLHPYSRGLIATIPSITGERKRLAGIPGIAPSPLEWPPGCRFHPRCERAMEVCKHEEPPMREIRPGRFVACYLYGGRA
jgi:peptide/nickel transport system ATP-binding protein